MNTLKLKYKKDRKVFVPDREVDLPDNFEIEIEKPVHGTGMTDEELEIYVQKLREEFVREFKRKYGIDMSNDPFLELLGCDARYLSKTTYKDDKKRIMEAIWEKYHND